ncbi:MAG TPA: TlpA disulfide reductase family protein [Anaeromyxobacteraceae bacterium]|nr:TlpA disulfide reductase family protein [Anaeromyxobacteraceae bacterium]
MKRTHVAILALGVLFAAAVVVTSLGRSPKPPPATPARPTLTPKEQEQAEERLLDEQAFSHPVNVPAPDVTVVGHDGKPVLLSALRGKVVFVNFWATWCPPCVEEMPSMLRLGASLASAHPDGFRMVAISGDDSWQAIHDYFQKNFGGPPPFLEVVRDPDASAARSYYCAARGYCPDVKFPETYIVGRDGRIVAMMVGPRDWSSPEARGLLDFLIRG